MENAPSNQTNYAEEASKKFPTALDMLREFVREVDIVELQDRISSFRDLDFKRISRDEIASQFAKVMHFGANDNNHRPSKIAIGFSFPVGTPLYRVRKFSNEAEALAKMEKEHGAWEPPAEAVSAQRLNKANESMLYASNHPAIALEETKVVDGDLVAIMVYEAIAPTMCLVIGMAPQDDELSRDENAKLKMLMRFLRDEFTREVGDGTEHQYKISETLAKEYFFVSATEQDGWIYPSVANKSGLNVCFRPEAAKSKLALRGFIAAIARVVEGNYVFQPSFVAQGFDSAGNFVHHPLDSKEASSLLRGLEPVPPEFNQSA